MTLPAKKSDTQDGATTPAAVHPFPGPRKSDRSDSETKRGGAQVARLARAGLTSFKLSEGQESAARAVKGWLADPSRKPIFRLFGYAGVGKTSVARLLADEVPGGAVYCAFTGKAALQMRKAGCLGAQTIHSLIYSPEQHDDGTVTFKLDRDSEARHAGIIVVDECSMVDETMANDLLSFGRPLLVLGDPAQLPPVGGDGVLTAAEPDAMLTEIHRQAADNPIIRLATDVREGRGYDYGAMGDQVRIIRPGVLSLPEVVEFDQLLCGTHKRRLAYMPRIREQLGHGSGLPRFGERLICTRNDRRLGIFNGGMFQVSECKPGRDKVTMRVLSQDGAPRNAVKVKCRRELFEGGAEDLHWTVHKGLQRFDFGYAITTHKAQGSQWDSVLVYDEGDVFRDDADRWRYTAVTRAAETLTVVKP